MSKKKKVAKGLGASVLAAATIVSGLSFGQAAMAAPAKAERAATNASMITGKLWFKGIDNWAGKWGYVDASKPLPSVSSASSEQAAISAASTLTMPAVGSLGPIRNAAGACLIAPVGEHPSASGSWGACASAPNYMHKTGGGQSQFFTESGNYRLESTDGGMLYNRPEQDWRTGNWNLADEKPVTPANFPAPTLSQSGNTLNAQFLGLSGYSYSAEFFQQNGSGQRFSDVGKRESAYLKPSTIPWDAWGIAPGASTKIDVYTIYYSGTTQVKQLQNTITVTRPKDNGGGGEQNEFDAISAYLPTKDSFTVSVRTTTANKTVQVSANGTSGWTTVGTSGSNAYLQQAAVDRSLTGGRGLWVREGTSGSGVKLDIRDAAVSNLDGTGRKLSGSGVKSNAKIHVSADHLKRNDYTSFTASGTSFSDIDLSAVPASVKTVTVWQGETGVRKEVTLTDAALADLVTGSSSDAVAIAGGETKVARATFEAKEAFARATSGSITFTAPSGTVFAAGQTAQRGQYFDGTAWQYFSGDSLVNGTLSNNGSTLTFDLNDRNWDVAKGQKFRFAVSVTAKDDTTAGTRSVSAVMKGVGGNSSSAPIGAFDATASTELNISASTANRLEGASSDAVSIDQGQTAKVHSTWKTTGAIGKLTGGTVVFTAPTGTKFAAGQDSQKGERYEDGRWVTNYLDTIKNGSLSADGRTYTFDIAAKDFSLAADTKVRFGLDLTADADATVGTRGLSAEFAGTADTGRLAATATTSIDVRSVAPVNNGFDAAGVGFSATVEEDKIVDVPFGLKATGDVSQFTLTDSELTAPAGTEFVAGTTAATAEVKRAGSDTWSKLAAADATVSVSGNKKNAVVSIADAKVDLRDGDTIRWSIPTKGLTAGTGKKVAFHTVGTTNWGAFDASGKSTLTVTAPVDVRPSALTNVEGYFTANVREWGHIKGQGAEKGATITVKGTDGSVIATGAAKADGTFDVTIDPAKVGDGVVTFSVTQSVADRGESDAAAATLDYGQNTPAFTTPTEGGTIVSEGQEFSGTGNTGGEVMVAGTDFANDIDIASGKVSGDRWSVKNDDISLPAGSYQIWVHQFTKGGKHAATPVNVSVVPAKLATLGSVEGYFTANVREWAHVKGQGAVKDAVISVKDANGTVVASGPARADGSFDFAIDPSKVGAGNVALTVTQTAPGSDESEPAAVSLDYGQNTPAFTTPNEGGVISSSGQEFAGTGNTGGEVMVAGTDFTNDVQIASGKVSGDRWSVQNDDIDLPAGSYQIWVHQFTKGGKHAASPVNVSVVPAKLATLGAVEGYFTTNVREWAHVKGQGAAKDATISVKDANGTVVASGPARADGSFDFAIDPSKVGYGQVALSVTQSVPGKVESDAAPVVLDYGQNTPAFTSPADGSTIASKDQEFTGTGNAGGEVMVAGTDFANDIDIASGKVSDGRWSVVNGDIELPGGAYQIWAHQFTKGGKHEAAGVSVRVDATPAAPTATGHIDADNTQRWAWIDGTAKAGATVTATDAAGTVVAEGTANASNGRYSLAIDPAKVGFGAVTLVVTQTVAGAQSHGIDVTLDYGTESPLAITGPAEGGTLNGSGSVTFTGTGRDGSVVNVTGLKPASGATVDFGKPKPTDGAWTLTKDVDLPAGDYQVWASQYTAGGKYSLVAVNVTVTR